MRPSVFHLLVVAVVLCWLVGSGLLLYGYLDELSETDRYQMAICTISDFKITIYDPSETYTLELWLFYKSLYGELTQKISLHPNVDLTTLESLLRTTITINSSFPCLVSFGSSSLQRIRDWFSRSFTRRETVTRIYTTWPSNTTPLILSAVFFGLGFLFLAIYLTIHFCIYYNRRVYRRLEGTGDEPFTLAESFKPLTEASCVASSFAKAQEVLWTNQEQFTAEDFETLKNLQVKAVVNPDERQVFQRTMVSVLKKLASRV